MNRYLEIGFRHKRLLLAPLVAALIATTAYVLMQPPSYQSTATLWASGGGVGTQSAAQSQVDIANQFLKTSSFAALVATKGPLANYLNDHPSALQSGVTGQIDSILGRTSNAQPSASAIRDYLAAHVTVIPLGPSEFTVTVNAPTPDVASGTANAIVTQLSSAEVTARTAPLITQLAVYQSQLQDLSKKLDTDLNAVATYLNKNPHLANDPAAAANDGTLTGLNATVSQDKQSYATLLGKIAQAQQDIQIAQQPALAPFRVIDAPVTPSTQAFLGKPQLLGIGAGLLAGLLLMAAMGALLARIDTTIHRPEEVQPMLGLRTIGSTPLSAKA